MVDFLAYSVAAPVEQRSCLGSWPSFILTLFLFVVCLSGSMVVYGNCCGSALTPLTLLLAQSGKMEESKPSELGGIEMGWCFVKDWTWFVVLDDDLMSG